MIEYRHFFESNIIKTNMGHIAKKSVYDKYKSYSNKMIDFTYLYIIKYLLGEKHLRQWNEVSLRCCSPYAAITKYPPISLDLIPQHPCDLCEVRKPLIMRCQLESDPFSLRVFVWFSSHNLLESDDGTLFRLYFHYAISLV